MSSLQHMYFYFCSHGSCPTHRSPTHILLFTSLPKYGGQEGLNPEVTSHVATMCRSGANAQIRNCKKKHASSRQLATPFALQKLLVPFHTMNIAMMCKIMLTCARLDAETPRRGVRGVLSVKLDFMLPKMPLAISKFTLSFASTLFY